MSRTAIPHATSDKRETQRHRESGGTLDRLRTMERE